MGLATTAEFEDFYRRHHEPMLRLACLLTQSRPAAEDAVHDAFLRTSVRWSGIDDPAAYLRRAVINACHSHHRRRRRDESTPLGEPGYVLQQHRELADAVAHLPYRYRAVLVLRFYLDLSEKETAEKLGWRQGTVKSTTHRALARLRSEVPR